MSEPTVWCQIQVLGIDSAVNPKNVGLAVATMSVNAQRSLTAVETGRRNAELSKQAVDLLDPSRPLLVAVDAPLGWPRALGNTLSQQGAGELLKATSDQLFTRQTDHFAHQHVGLKPLNVGADRIARTAQAALALIDRLRSRIGQPVPLLMSPNEAPDGGLNEVYPAATLKRHGLPSKGYKKQEARSLRETIVAGFEQRLTPGVYESACLASDHCLDAAMCVLTGLDFLAGGCEQPQDSSAARSEGWIWFPTEQ